MSICPKPDKQTAFLLNPTPSTLLPSLPDPRDESCNQINTSVTTTGGSTPTSTTVYVQGPPGPAGADGSAGCSLGFEWKGTWSAGEVYVKQECPSHPNGSVVNYNGSTFLCTADHISDISIVPPDPNSTDVTGGAAYWDLLSSGASGTGSLSVPEKSFFDKLKTGIFDWVDTATVGDWIGAAVIGAGVVWAGTQIYDMMTNPGTSGSTDIKYTGSDGYNGAIEGTSLKALLGALCDYSGVAYDVSLLTDVNVSMPISNNPRVADVIAELSNVYQFDRFESGGILKFVPRNITPVKSIYLTDLGFNKNAVPGVPIIFKREQGLNLPRQVSVTYTSVAQDYGKFGQTSQLLSFQDGQDMTVSTAITLDDTYAKKLADITLVNANIQRSTMTFTTTLDHVDVEVGDIVDLETVGPVRVLSIDENDDGLLDFISCDAGSPTNIAYSSPTGVIVAPTISNNVATDIGVSGTFFVDLPTLNASDTDFRMYAATHGYGLAGWPGAKIYRSDDNGASYSEIAIAHTESTVGMVAVATANANYQVWDDTTLIEVTLKTGSLSTKPDIAVLNGENRCMVGREMIVFGTATLIGPKQYRLSHLLRGRQGTDAFVATHEANELFVLIDSALVEIKITKDERTKSFKYKTVTIGGDISAVSADTVQCLSANWIPWRVARPLLTHAVSDWNLTWDEVLKFDNALKDYTDLNHDSDYSGFAVAILDSSNNIKRKTVVWTNTYTYSAADQITDFGSTQSSIRMSVAQMSNVVGGGYPYVINS